MKGLFIRLIWQVSKCHMKVIKNLFSKKIPKYEINLKSSCIHRIDTWAIEATLNWFKCQNYFYFIFCLFANPCTIQWTMLVMDNNTPLKWAGTAPPCPISELVLLARPWDILKSQYFIIWTLVLCWLFSPTIDDQIILCFINFVPSTMCISPYTSSPIEWAHTCMIITFHAWCMCSDIVWSIRLKICAEF